MTRPSSTGLMPTLYSGFARWATDASWTKSSSKDSGALGSPSKSAPRRPETIAMRAMRVQ